MASEERERRTEEECKKVSKDINVEKKAFHRVKKLKQALKKAQQFELRKIMRRLSESKGISNVDTKLPDERRKLIEKFESKVERCRALDVLQLSRDMAHELGVQDETIESALGKKDPSDAFLNEEKNEESMKAVEDRLRRSACVQKEVDAIRLVLNAPARARKVREPRKKAERKRSTDIGVAKKKKEGRVEKVKNRLGQRARRRLAKSIHGWQANHIQNKLKIKAGTNDQEH